MQFQADILNVPVHRPKVLETTALGAAYLAGLAVEFWKDQNEIKANWAVDREFTVQMEEALRAVRYQGWHKAVKRAMDWEDK